MKGNKDCRAYKELAMEAMDRMIGGENKALLDAHVKICPDCRKYIADMKKIKKAVSAGYEAPFFLETRIMEEIKPVSSFWFLVSSRIKPAITFAASFGLVLIVSLLIINKGFDNKTVTIADMPVIHNTVSNSAR